MRLTVGVLVHDANLDRFGVVVDAGPLEAPTWVLVRWEPLAANLPAQRLEAEVFAPMPRYRVIS